MSLRWRKQLGRQEDQPGPITRLIQWQVGQGGGTPNGVEPPGELVAEVKQTITKRLIKILKGRNQWHASPRNLGVIDRENWWASDEHLGSAIEELMLDVFSHLFVDKREALAKRLGSSGESDGLANIDGVANRIVTNYIHDRQEKEDPVGARVYRVVKTGVRRAIERGVFKVLAGEPTINATTLMAPLPQGLGESLNWEELRPMVVEWNSRLLPELVTGFGPQSRKLHAELSRCLEQLAEQGRSFLFGDLQRELLADVRVRWAALYASDEGASVQEEEEERPRLPWRTLASREPSIIEADHLRKLLDCVTERLARLVRPPEELARLQTLWGFLLRFTADEAQERVPSRRKLGPELGIPRQQLTSLYATLKQLIDKCRTALGNGNSEAAKDGKELDGRTTSADRG